MATTDDAAKAAAKSAGAPKDLADAFVREAVSWPSAQSADANVATAFELGWLVRTLHVSTTGDAQSQPILLGGPDRRSGADDDVIDNRDEMLQIRIRVLAGRMQKRLRGIGEAEVDIARLDIPADTEAAARHRQTLEALQVMDVSLSEAYMLGWRLRRSYPDSVEGVEGSGTVGRVKQLLAANAQEMDRALWQLASKLPPNAAHSVRHSLALWQAQLATVSDGLPADRFGEQLEDWRSMLKGDVAARDLLRASDYVGTVEGVMTRLRDVARASMRRKAFVVFAAIIGVLLAATVVLFAIGQGDATVAGLGTLAAAAGLTWKGVGEFFGRAAAKGEKALWDAQLDWTIAYRCTLPASDEEVAPVKGKPKDDLAKHLAEWREWRRRWPDIESEASAKA